MVITPETVALAIAQATEEQLDIYARALADRAERLGLGRLLPYQILNGMRAGVSGLVGADVPEAQGVRDAAGGAP